MRRWICGIKEIRGMGIGMGIVYLGLRKSSNSLGIRESREELVITKCRRRMFLGYWKTTISYRISRLTKKSSPSHVTASMKDSENILQVLHFVRILFAFCARCVR